MGKYQKTAIVILCAAALVFVLPACKRKTPAQDGEDQTDILVSKPPVVEHVGKSLVIKPNVGIGEVKFGMSLEKVKRILGEPASETPPILGYPHLGLTITLRDDTVLAIVCGDMTNKDSDLIKACRCRTEKGIGIGSTEAEIIAAYGEPTTKRGPRLMYRQLNARFVLADGKVIGMWFAKPRKLTND